MGEELALTLNGVAVDALREAGSIGAGHVATVLSEILATRVEMSVPRAVIRSVWEALDLLGETETPAVGLYVSFRGEARGSALFLLSQEGARSLLTHLLPRAPAGVGDLGEMELSALLEAGNIVISAFLCALGDFTGLRILPSVPAVAVDMAGAILGSILVQLGEKSDYAFIIETNLAEVADGVQGHFLILPEPQTLSTLLTALGVQVKFEK